MCPYLPSSCVFNSNWINKSIGQSWKYVWQFYHYCITKNEKLSWKVMYFYINPIQQKKTHVISTKFDVYLHLQQVPGGKVVFMHIKHNKYYCPCFARINVYTKVYWRHASTICIFVIQCHIILSCRARKSRLKIINIPFFPQ